MNAFFGGSLHRSAQAAVDAAAVEAASAAGVLETSPGVPEVAAMGARLPDTGTLGAFAFVAVLFGALFWKVCLSFSRSSSEYRIPDVEESCVC